MSFMRPCKTRYTAVHAFEVSHIRSLQDTSTVLYLEMSFDETLDLITAAACCYLLICFNPLYMPGLAMGRPVYGARVIKCHIYVRSLQNTSTRESPLPQF